MRCCILEQPSKKKNKKNKLLNSIIFAAVGLIVVFIGYLFIFPVTPTNADVTAFIEKELTVNNVTLLDEVKLGEDGLVGGRFVLFSYSDGYSYGKASFTSLGNRLKVKEIYTNAVQEELHVVKVKGEYHRVMGVLNPNLAVSLFAVTEGTDYKEFPITKPYTLVTYPIKKEALQKSVKMSYFDKNGAPLPNLK